MSQTAETAEERDPNSARIRTCRFRNWKPNDPIGRNPGGGKRAAFNGASAPSANDAFP